VNQGITSRKNSKNGARKWGATTAISRSVLGCLAAGILCAGTLSADPQDSSLLETEFYPVGSRFGLDVRSSSVAGVGASLVGASWLAGYTGGLSIGLGVNSLASSIDAPAGYGSGRLSLWYAGLVTEYEAWSWSMLNLSATNLVGIGRVGYRGVAAGNLWHEGPFTVIEPGVIATVNLSSRSRLGLGSWWRFASRSEGPASIVGKLGGPSIGLTIRTGIF
jgi:hypothetical protein